MNEMRKLINLLEARMTDNPDVSYDLEGETKAKTLSGEFSKITATVTGPSSAQFTRLANKFKKIDEFNKEIKQLRDTANAEAKQHIEELFDAEDAVLTRYIDTVSLAITMAKDTPEREEEDEVFEAEDFLEELYEMVDDNLVPMIQQLKEKHTKIENTVVSGRKGTLKVKTKEAAGAVDYSKLEQLADTLGEIVDIKMSQYDQKLQQLKSAFLS